MNKRKIIVALSAVAVLAVMVVGGSLLGEMKEEPEKKAAVQAKKYVRTTTVVYSDLKIEVETFGRVKTEESLELIPEVAGKMSQGRVPLKAGQRFKKGDLLFKIDNTEARLTLFSKKSNFLKDLAATLPDFKLDFKESYQTWLDYFNSIEIDNSIPELPSPKNSKEKTYLATKNIFSSYYSIKSDEARLRKYAYYAPFNGSITEVTLQNGSFVNPGNKIGKIIQTDKHEIKVSVDPADISWVDIGSEVTVFSEGEDKNWTGTVSRISDVINPNTQSIDVYVKIKKGEQSIYEGYYLKAKIPGRVVENSMEIPRNAVFNTNEVFVLKDSTLKVRQIKVHKINQQTIVMTGLQEGAQLVVEPLINAHNNMKAFNLETEEEEKGLVNGATVTTASN